MLGAVLLMLGFSDMTQRVSSKEWRRGLVGAWLSGAWLLSTRESKCHSSSSVPLYCYHMLRLNNYTFEALIRLTELYEFPKTLCISIWIKICDRIKTKI
jgi:hypothetical protein